MKINHFFKVFIFSLYDLTSRVLFVVILLRSFRIGLTDIGSDYNQTIPVILDFCAVFSYSRDNGSATLLFLRVRPSVFVPVEANPEQINFLFSIMWLANDLKIWVSLL